METLSALILQWQNAVFTAAIAFCIFYLFMYMAGVAGHDADVDADHDIDHDVDHDISHDTDHDAEIDQPGITDNILSFLCIGRCPLSIVLMTLGISWGFVGLCANGIFSKAKVIPPGIYFWFSAGIATVFGLAFTRLVASTLAKYMPTKETSVVSKEGLIGSMGESSTVIDNDGGRARVRDQFGTLHNIYCRTGGNDSFIPENKEIIVTQYIIGEGVFLVKKRPTLADIQII